MNYIIQIIVYFSIGCLSTAHNKKSNHNEINYGRVSFCIYNILGFLGLFRGEREGLIASPQAQWAFYTNTSRTDRNKSKEREMRKVLSQNKQKSK